MKGATVVSSTATTTSTSSTSSTTSITTSTSVPTTSLTTLTTSVATSSTTTGECRILKDYFRLLCELDAVRSVDIQYFHRTIDHGKLNTELYIILVICNPLCLNGGTCVLPNHTCLCIADVWTGPQCQMRKSHPLPSASPGEGGILI